MSAYRSEECREDVESTETWNGGAGTVTFNHLQQHKEGFDPEREETPLEAAGTTDPWGIADE